ncbi:hypothetical protein P170DRAFT_45736 [Aspergillus steynii IBT 23096]|uniref:Uncharacterized protein n=1 Tax=Aspergillus steynii IBT 23096 TaxID=1392250 RepID=A0A2I2GRX4_9EURO|nr:uncharacterized protein P170DRAFT_45736 [Aspergillus steynii IBT 23096]PLB55625.1 hypothetical protein P170DRAFT_45736 [Aspergillus steynii IBT 23096]
MHMRATRRRNQVWRIEMARRLCFWLFQNLFHWASCVFWSQLTAPLFFVLDSCEMFFVFLFPSSFTCAFLVCTYSKPTTTI